METAKPRILIADDEENILTAVSIVLKEAFDITTASRPSIHSTLAWAWVNSDGADPTSIPACCIASIAVAL